MFLWRRWKLYLYFINPKKLRCGILRLPWTPSGMFHLRLKISFNHFFWLIFWYVNLNSFQVLFSMSQKLIQHQIMNYTDVLKWLRKILECRNQFLKRHRSYANVGSQLAICRQAHIKLEVNILILLWFQFWRFFTVLICQIFQVVFFMYLWSIDLEAVLVSMSCFSLLCEEADIRAGSDEVTATALLPNYHIYGVYINIKIFLHLSKVLNWQINLP